ncbi:MAG: response regulator [Acidobacteriia bacterium]|nr:response regulator [Terriglobia bacterium]
MIHPAHVATAASKVQPDVPDPVEEKSAKSRVLIVDDEPGIAKLLHDWLAHADFECRACTHAEEALALIEQQAFDAVISDMRMPGMTGMELLQRVRPTHPLLAFLMATAVDDVRVGIQAMREGADDYLVKPFHLENVLASVNRALEKKGLEREVADYRQHLEQMVDQRTRQLQAAMKRIEQTYDDTLEALAAALDLRDNETAGHSRRVTSYCMEIARLLNCSDAELRVIQRGAYLHDIGKIGIPDSILLKPGKLTEAERTVMETHVRIGYELVCRIAFLAAAAEIILTHQERFDGTGYPQGLVGEEIPLGARIFSVADTLDAMTSDRPYRRALSYATARAEIIRESGRQFDPRVVQAFLSIPEARLDKIRAESLQQATNARRHATSRGNLLPMEGTEPHKPSPVN